MRRFHNEFGCTNPKCGNWVPDTTLVAETEEEYSD